MQRQQGIKHLLQVFEALERKDSSTPLIILDEIHKYKGKHYFLVSGSGRLDLYQKGGDSLPGLKIW